MSLPQARKQPPSPLLLLLPRPLLDAMAQNSARPTPNPYPDPYPEP